MIIPGKRVCELCQNEIKPGQRFITVTLPMPKAERDRVLADVEKRMPKQPGSIFGLLIGQAPEMWEIEVCDCLTALLPQLLTARTEAVTRWLKFHEEARERRAREEV